MESPDSLRMETTGIEKALADHSLRVTRRQNPIMPRQRRYRGRDMFLLWFQGRPGGTHQRNRRGGVA